MSNYHRQRVPGATFFFTVRLLDRRSTLLTDHIAAFGNAIRQTRAKMPFHVDAWIVLPNHSHSIWTLPPGDLDYPARWKAVKIAFSKSVQKSTVRRAKAGLIWERRYQDHPIGDDAEYDALVDYVHANAVRHGHCSEARAWPWSSLHRYEAGGMPAPHAEHNVLALQA